MLNTPRHAPAWLTADDWPSSIFTKGKSLMSLLAKILTTKKADATASISPLAQLEKEIDSAIAAAERRGVSPGAVVSALERAEQAERYRVAAGHRF
jgi:hypothetical protein